MARPTGSPQSQETKGKISLALKEQWTLGVRKPKGRGGVEKQCTTCGIKMLLSKSLVTKKKQFCSKACYGKFLTGKKLSNEHRRKLSIAKKGRKASAGTIYALKKRSGTNCHFWRGGLPSCIDCRKKLSTYHSKTNKCKKCYGTAWIADRTQLKKSSEESKYRNSPAHKDWSKNVKNRDGWKCKISNGDCSGRLEAHHILGWKSHPELRYQTNNGITLCHAHHPRKREDETRLSPYFQELVLKAN
jgi:hypothetical protein